MDFGFVYQSAFMEEISVEKILDVQDLSIRINHKPLVDHVSFSVGEGEAILLSGANGIGKSTVLKSVLRLESEGKDISGKIIERSFGDILSLNSTELQHFRASIAYVQQKDEYSEMGGVQVRDIISESRETHRGGSLSNSEVNDLIDKWIPRRSDGKRVFDAKSKPAKFSGGEQRLLSVLSVIAARPNAELMIIDEPLNNLDFVNARNISNLINRVIMDNPRMGLLMISHCRIFPFITREIKLTANGIFPAEEYYACHSCIGEPDTEGFYRE